MRSWPPIDESQSRGGGPCSGNGSWQPMPKRVRKDLDFGCARTHDESAMRLDACTGWLPVPGAESDEIIFLDAGV